MKRIAVITPPEQFQEEQLFTLLETWNNHGVDTKLFSTTLAQATGERGGKARPHGLIASVKVEDFDAIAVTGGRGSLACLWDNVELHKMLQTFDFARKPTTAICAGVIALARAGLLVGKAATVFPALQMIQEIRSRGAIYIPAEVISTGWIVTAAQSEHAELFASYVIKVIEKRKELAF
ncbi:DJ-1/PfpI family protein [Paraburkholderia sp. SARCC-3016]|uniref:DJ-1/PfpI family protein n=1 Tax=Paraburkholderia sp. SARCC-3016 TaxID=3058611 RepID=UPI002806D2E0|nr:DJ-1/PfpI family protein [Paraburkholderia sp. SARCC-3016]MDQ7982374.1 DJ-1/PfpI family protein [Paraburkholderia sp. SARCC-3016]